MGLTQGLLLLTLQCTAQPYNKELSGPNVNGATVETSWARLRYSLVILKMYEIIFVSKTGLWNIIWNSDDSQKMFSLLNNKNKTGFCPVDNNSECSIRGHCVDLQT